MDNRAIEEVRENETKLIDEIKQLEKENQELKKQLKELEESSANAINKQVARGIELVNQQKEFIEWLDSMLVSELGVFTEVKICDVLSKYKEIIGKDINVSIKGDDKNARNR